MFRRFVAILLLLLAALLASPISAAAPQRIVAVGDLHGDYQAWLTIARAAGLIDDRNDWAGGKTTLVQLGDVADREADSLQIIRSLQRLQREAPRKGGRVIVVLGNHEAMNLIGDYRYTTPGEFAAFADSESAARREKLYELNKAAIEASSRAKTPNMTAEAIKQAWIAATPLGWVEHKLAWMPSGEIGKWATHNPALVKIGGTLFVHGGLSAEYAKIPMDELNRRVAAAMAAADESPTSVLTDPLGPLWYRGLIRADPEAQAVRARAPGPKPSAEQELAAVLAAYGAQRMVVGHTPNPSGIAITNGGRLIDVDTAISRHYGGPLTWLEIIGDTLTPHTVPRGAK